ncbi:FliM/FliN family flagellar motor switch protein [Nitratiruptor sp. YY09-18]|uniref:FliM/FliN family flagellar motor switch protein n=1 Tax=Nitratiruptor sp. YY09-18 TaxID=2724901 RepID=UPI001936DB2E|nr:FliM/FliN family flagellar motor switch protein [Nitratiruptor sp. YY09-18]BCD68380.1 flagellar motor switch protein FliN/FliY [Nitratiruptor sp. YY09-18]
MMKNPQNPQIDFLKDVNLRFNIEIGRVKKLLVEILSLKEGDVIELEKNIDEYIDVQLNNKPFAIGEMVIANEKYGVRIIDLAR